MAIPTQTRKCLAEAEQKLLAGKTADATDDLQRILDELEPYLITIDGKSFQTAQWMAQKILAKLPSEALKNYRDQITSFLTVPPRKLLETAKRTREPATLWQLLDKYFVSRPADEGSLMLGDILFNAANSTPRNSYGIGSFPIIMRMSSIPTPNRTPPRSVHGSFWRRYSRAESNEPRPNSQRSKPVIRSRVGLLPAQLSLARDHSIRAVQRPTQNIPQQRQWHPYWADFWRRPRSPPASASGCQSQFGITSVSGLRLCPRT